MRTSKGFIFTTDAIFAFYLITIMLSVLLLLSYSPKIYTEQSQTLAKDILNAMNNIKMSDLANDSRFPFSANLVYMKRNSVSSWSMFLHTPEHNNSLVSVYPRDASLLWNSGPGLGGSGFTVDSSPIVYNGKVVITSKNGTYLIDENTGHQFWYLPIPAISTPAVSNGRLFIGSTNNIFYSIDEAGNIVWNQTFSGPIISSPVVHNGKVFFGSMNGNVYALDQYTGNITWFFTPPSGNISSSPAVSDNKVFVVSNNAVLYALDEDTYGLLWSFNTSYDPTLRTDVPFDPSPAVANKTVYFGYTDLFYAINTTNGSLIWAIPAAEVYMYTSSPVIDNGIVYVGSSYGLVVINATNGLILRYSDIGSTIVATPLVANDSVITVTMNGLLTVRYKSNWSTIWSYNMGSRVFSSPVLVNGRIYVITEDGNLFVFGNCSLWDENMSAMDTISAFWLIGKNSLNVSESLCAQALGKEMLDSMVPSNYGSELVIKSAGIPGLSCSGSPSDESSVYTNDCNKTKYQRILIRDSKYISRVVQEGSTIYYAQNPLQFELRIWN
ncbi:MAG: PQQ-binding-like beta-propeller repeat protein [Candidatus Micrarchaeota archaeon]|nr:PQQ-binding-like beta-propeller repeat protein [Candidatus Micrarchaeota archaeon]